MEEHVAQTISTNHQTIFPFLSLDDRLINVLSAFTKSSNTLVVFSSDVFG